MFDINWISSVKKRCFGEESNRTQSYEVCPKLFSVKLPLVFLIVAHFKPGQSPTLNMYN